MLLALALAHAEPPAYDLRIEGAHETCLLGEADAAWVAEVLAPEGLEPAGGAMLCAMAMTWEGRDFQEAVFVLGTAPAGERPAGWFLLSALNTRTFFAWVERTRNRAPYWPGKVLRDPGEALARVSLAGRRGGIVDALAPAPAPESVQAVDQPFVGPIHLPGRRWFDAEFTGAQTVWDFRPGVDRFALGSLTADPMATALHASGFVPKRWAVREAAAHSKTDTRGPRE